MMNVRNLSFLIGAALFSVTASAATIFTDTFDSGTAADAGYYRFGTTNTTLAVGSGTLNYAYTNGETRAGLIKSFAEQTLAVGDSLIFSFDIDSRTLASGQNHAFRWAIGNLGNPSAVTGVPVTADLSSVSPFGSGTREMYQFSASTGTTAGFGQYVTGSTSPVHNNSGTATAIGGGFTGPASIANSGASSISLTLTRTATGFDFSQTAFGSSTSGSLTGGTNIFNNLAVSFNNAGAYSASIDNVSVSVIPEPSTLGLAAIALLSELVFKRRKA